MPEQDISFRREDIEKVQKELQEKKETREFRNLTEREIVKETIRPLVRPPLKSQVLPQPKLTSKKSTIASEDALPSYAKDADEKTRERVERLLSLAFQSGIENAAREAERSDPFSLDAFHDALTDKLYDELKKRGII